MTDDTRQTMADEALALPEYRTAVNTLADTLGITRHAAARIVVAAVLNGYQMGGRA